MIVAPTSTSSSSYCTVRTQSRRTCRDAHGDRLSGVIPDPGKNLRTCNLNCGPPQFNFTLKTVLFQSLPGAFTQATLEITLENKSSSVPPRFSNLTGIPLRLDPPLTATAVCRAVLHLKHFPCCEATSDSMACRHEWPSPPNAEYFFNFPDSPCEHGIPTARGRCHHPALHVSPASPLQEAGQGV